TGNVSLISDHVSIGQLIIATAFASIVALFVLGAFAASLFIQLGKHKNWRRVYALTLLAEACLLLVVGALDIQGSGLSRGTLIVGILSFTMGIQNAASTRISTGRVRTTHVSGVATDIGVGLATLWRSHSAEASIATIQRLKLHSATILSFLIGGIAGVVAYRFVQGAVFWAASLPLFLLCARYLRR
ncbi:MAG: YoaK family protein, partial [Phyllobacterium sp.]|uniref:YoaK family protein n=1 Tax=Phyllobacterium sp. TaxID=1871046 RepID=UPI0030F1A445